ncbi:MAG: hypothetical protein AAGC55_04390 [Myxococcota bacterium]
MNPALTRLVKVCRSRLAVLLIIVAISGVTVSGPAYADDDVEAQALALFEEGIRLFNQGQFKQACAKLEASVDLYAGVGNRGKLAECWARMGRHASAYRLYREVQKLAADVGDLDRARVADERASELQTKLSYLIVKPGPSVAASGFRITHNGIDLAPSRYSGKMAVDPGQHLVVAAAPGHRPWQQSVRLQAAEVAEVAVPALIATGQQFDDRSDVRRGGGSRAMTIMAIGLVGVGAATMVGGSLWFGERANSDWDKVKTSGVCSNDSGDWICPDTAEGDEVLDYADSARSNANLANLSAGLGAALVITGVVLWLTSGGDSGDADDHRAQFTRPRVTPVVGEQAAGLVLTGRF